MRLISYTLLSGSSFNRAIEELKYYYGNITCSHSPFKRAIAERSADSIVSGCILNCPSDNPSRLKPKRTEAVRSATTIIKETNDG